MGTIWQFFDFLWLSYLTGIQYFSMRFFHPRLASEDLRSAAQVRDGVWPLCRHHHLSSARLCKLHDVPRAYTQQEEDSQ